jgi:hypothetical protein
MSAVTMPKPNQNAPARRLERLNDNPTSSSQSWRGFNSADARATALQGGGKSDAAKAEFISLFIGSTRLPFRGGRRIYANFSVAKSAMAKSYLTMSKEGFILIVL